MAVIHIVLFEFKSELSQSEVSTLFKEVLALKDKCIHPESKVNYIKSHGGGLNISQEGHSGGLTHGFVYEFANEADRDYYVKEDPHHLAIVEKLKVSMAGIRVFDYVQGSV